MGKGTEGLADAKIRTADLTISSGTTTAEFDLKGGTLLGIRCPSGIASSTVKIVSSSASGGTFVEELETGLTSDKSYAVVASKRRPIPPADTAGLRFIKLVFSNTETTKTFTIDYRSIE